MYRLFIIIILVLAIGYFLFRNMVMEGMNGIEGLTNDEAIQNIASLYNDENMKITNLDVTGTLTNPTIEETIAKLQKSIAAQAAQASQLNSRISGVNSRVTSLGGEFGKYVKKGEVVQMYQGSTGGKWQGTIRIQSP